MAELLPFKIAIGRNANFQILGGERGSNVKIHHRDPQVALPCAKTRRIDRENRSTVATCRRGEETKRKKESQTVIFHACA